MGVSCERTRTIYLPIPKVACTSLKKMFWELNTGHAFPSKPNLFRRALRKCRVHIDVPKIQREPGYETADFDSNVVVPDGYESVALIRDPISRLRSAWASKVIERVFRQHDEVATIEAAGLSASPSFSEFIENFDTYRSLSQPVRRHTEPQAQYLGNDITVFDRVFRLEEMPKLETYLSMRAGTVIKAPRENRSSRNVRDDRVHRGLSEKIREITRADFELLGSFYNFDAALERHLRDETGRYYRLADFSEMKAGSESPF